MRSNLDENGNEHFHPDLKQPDSQDEEDKRTKKANPADDPSATVPSGQPKPKP